MSYLRWCLPLHIFTKSILPCVGAMGRVEELFQRTHPENVKGECGWREKLFGAFFAFSISMFNGCSVSFVRAKMLNQFDMWQQQVWHKHQVITSNCTHSTHSILYVSAGFDWYQSNCEREKEGWSKWEHLHKLNPNNFWWQLRQCKIDLIQKSSISYCKCRTPFKHILRTRKKCMRDLLCTM